MCHLFPAGSLTQEYILLLKAMTSCLSQMPSIAMEVCFSDISFDICQSEK